ncbi:MAG: alpha/beta hydrolase [Actinomycetes bacterium]
MAWILLVFGVVSLGHVINAFRPVRRNRLFFVWSFFAAWLTIELATFWLIVDVVVVAVLVWRGALLVWPGWLGLALVVLSFVAQAVLYGQGRDTSAIARQAMDGFGTDVIAARTNIERSKVTIDRNIDYRKVDGKRLRLDVFRPKGESSSQARRPAILQIHGGGWIIGDKREQGLPLLRYLVARGWVGFNVNYRLSPGVTFPGHLVDIKAALAWIREHADEYGIDPNFVVVTGGSAGGHLATLMALTANDPRYQPGFELADTSVQAAVPFYGVYDFMNRNHTMPDFVRDSILGPLVVKAFIDDEPEKFSDASPIDHIHADAPPFLVVHGDKDTLAPVADARHFVEQLREESSSTVFYVELHGAQHAFEVFSSPRARRIVKAIEQFLYVVHQDHQSRAIASATPADVSVADR